MAVPYTYLIGWSEKQIYYYGVRFAKACHPDDLWKTYFTSSKYVDEVVKKYGDPDILQIRKTFRNPNAAMIWESKVLKRLGVTKRDDFLNKWDGKHCDIDILRKPKSKDHKQKISEALTGRSHLAGEKNPMYGKRGKNNPNFGVPKTEDHKQKIREALTGKKHTEERRKNMSLNCPKNSLGKKWYHNPTSGKQSYFVEGEQPVGWLKGRGKIYGCAN